MSEVSLRSTEGQTPKAILMHYTRLRFLFLNREILSNPRIPALPLLAFLWLEFSLSMTTRRWFRSFPTFARNADTRRSPTPPGRRRSKISATHAPQLVITDVRMDKVGGLDVLRECREVLPADAGDHDHRLQDGRDRHRGDEDGRVRLHHQAVQGGRAAAHDPARARSSARLAARTATCGRSSRRSTASRTSSARRTRMQEIYNLIAKVADTDSHDSDPGRERHGQGTRRARAAFQLQPAASAVRRDQLLGAAGESAGVRALRPQEGLLHRRGAGQDRPLRGGGAGHHLPR